MYIFKVTKSDEGAASLEVFASDGENKKDENLINNKNDEDRGFASFEQASFSDLYTLNFYLQTIAAKYKTSGGLLIVHNKTTNDVQLFLAKETNTLFVG